MWIISCATIALLMAGVIGGVPEEEDLSENFVRMDDMWIHKDLYAVAFPDSDNSIGHAPLRSDIYALWNIFPDGDNYLVPYIVDPTVSDSMLYDVIMPAIQDIEDAVCLRFVQRTDEPYWFYFTSAFQGCNAQIGRPVEENSPYRINLQDPGCAVKGIAIHEILHVLGFLHEHQRPDRDDYVIILDDEINPTYASNFDMYNEDVLNSLGSPFDFNSVMMYEDSAFSIEIVEKTIMKLDGSGFNSQRIGLADSDAKQLHALYQCPGAPPNIPPFPTDPECQDQISSCDLLAKTGACFDRPCEMKERCERACGFCYCEDSVFFGRSCSEMKEQGLCNVPKYAGWMRISCPLSCGFCGLACEDKAEDCAAAMVKTSCHTFDQYLVENCRETCGYCVARWS